MSAGAILSRLELTPAEAAAPFHLRVGPYGVAVRCPGPMRAALMDYFADALWDGPLAEETEETTVLLLPGQQLSPEPAWTEWAREPGKSGRKDAVQDLRDGRLIRKIRSGATFLQSDGVAVGWGPLEENFSTTVNFINTQLLGAAQRDGWVLCHAAAATDGARGLAVSGLSGGGKSTSILRLLDLDGVRFLSNDRVLARGGAAPRALGIPKQPRINPGTILGNPRLHGMLSAARLAELRAMPGAALWALEEKRDLIVGEVYGPGKVQLDGPLTDFWVLNWSRDADAPTELAEVELAERPDLLSAIMKSPGPFHQHADGRFEPPGARPDPAPYLAALSGLRVRELRGRVDFDAVARFGRALFHG